MQNNNVNITHCSQTFEDLASGFASGKFEHLRLIVTKNDNRAFGQIYLMISRNNFDLVKLHNVDFVNNQISLDMEDMNGLRKKVLLDIDDPTFKFLLVSWQDIKQVMKLENVNKPDSADLLDFEF